MPSTEIEPGPVRVQGADAEPSPGRGAATRWVVVGAVLAAVVFAVWDPEPVPDPVPGVLPGIPEHVPVTEVPLDVGAWFGTGVRLHATGPALWAYELDAGRLARYEDGSWRVGDTLSDGSPRFLTSASVAWVGVDPNGRVWMSGYAAVEESGRTRRYEASIWYDDGDRWRLLPPVRSQFGADPVDEIAFAPDGETVYLVTETWGGVELQAWDGAELRRLGSPIDEPANIWIRGLAVTGDGLVWVAGDSYVGWEIVGTFLASYDPATERWTRADVPTDGLVTSVTESPTGELWLVVESPWTDEYRWASARRSPDSGTWSIVEMTGPPPMTEILAADRSALWLAGWNDRGVVRVGDDGSTVHLRGEHVTDLAVAADGTVWVVFGDRPGVHRLELEDR